MALQLGALRDALVDAGAKPEMARAAAKEAAGYENRLASIDGEIAALQASTESQVLGLRAYLDGQISAQRASTDLRFERVEGKLTLLQWMLGVQIAATASIVLKVFL